MALSELKTKDDTSGLLKKVGRNECQDSSEEEPERDDEGNTGWADCIAKVLSTTKPKTKKTLVLSRAKKLKPGDNLTSLNVDYGFEVDGEETIGKFVKVEAEEQIKQRRNVPLELRVKPSWKDKERERTLRKVATRGVVQLFNAVRIQQKDIQQQLDAAGPLDSRKDAILNNINKQKFLDVLMSGNRAKSEAIDNPVKNESLKEENSSEDDDDHNSSNTNKKRKSEWSVLREDFMTNKKIKHWDEDDDENEDAPGTSDKSDSEDD